ncbi:hypothetical protein [Lysinibacillus sp. NPDC059133]|uniref:hypothetical protein n=1 Tax=Lysinibacillus sp. NPDC059133 TaxID=3346737 RepID=UPI0036BC2E07
MIIHNIQHKHMFYKEKSTSFLPPLKKWLPEAQFCELPFENYSRTSNQFTIEFYERYPFEDDVRIVTLMNNDAPYEVKLRGKERKRVIIETDIDVSQMENHIDGGQANYVTIIIKSGEITRKL